MTMQLSLPPELEQRLHMAALKKGKPADQVAVQLLEENLPPIEEKPSPTEKYLAARELLRAWTKEAEAMTDEESAENEAILRAIDENRMSDRKLFTDILKNKTP